MERWKFTFIRRYLHTNVFSEHFTEVNITMDRSPNWTGQLDTIFSNRKDILLCNLWIYRRLWRYLGQYSQYFDTLLDLKTWTVFTVKNRNILLVLFIISLHLNTWFIGTFFYLLVLFIYCSILCEIVWTFISSLSEKIRRTKTYIMFEDTEKFLMFINMIYLFFLTLNIWKKWVIIRA